MSEDSKQSQQRPIRGQVLGQIIAAQKLQPQGVGPVQDVGAQARFGLRLQTMLAHMDAKRMQIRQQSGWAPGLLLDRRAQRRSEFLSALTRPRTAVVTQEAEPEPEQASPPPPAFLCPWVKEGCTFKTDSPEELQSHVLTHTRTPTKTY